jgi:type IV secretory pathway VirJ component
VLLPKVGHGFSVPRNWMPQFRAAFGRIASGSRNPAPAARAGAVGDLPLIEVPASGSQSSAFAVIVTGDGGWGVTDRGIGESLAARGVPTVGLNSLQYFWDAKTPEQAAGDLGRILSHYLEIWKKQQVVLIGYSLGADVMPFMINRLPLNLHSRIKLAALIGLGSTVNFEFHLVDWLATIAHRNSLPVRPEVEKLKGLKILCFYGREDDDALCGNLEPALATAVVLEGGHRVGRGFEKIVDSILAELR